MTIFMSFAASVISGESRQVGQIFLVKAEYSGRLEPNSLWNGQLQELLSQSFVSSRFLLDYDEHDHGEYVQHD